MLLHHTLLLKQRTCADCAHQVVVSDVQHSHVEEAAVLIDLEHLQAILEGLHTQLTQQGSLRGTHLRRCHRRGVGEGGGGQSARQCTQGTRGDHGRITAGWKLLRTGFMDMMTKGVKKACQVPFVPLTCCHSHHCSSSADTLCSCCGICSPPEDISCCCHTVSHLVTGLDEVHLRDNLNGTLVNLGGNGQGLHATQSAQQQQQQQQQTHQHTYEYTYLMPS
jgi:hypothetical protein